MPNIARVMKDEISRIARKEAKHAVAPLHRHAADARRTFANLKRCVAALEKENKRMAALLAKVPQPEPEAPAKAKGWISGRGVRSLRQKLGLSQEAFAKLVSVTPNAVWIWESKPGMLRMRDATKAAVMAVRGLGAREAKAKLATMKAVKKPAGKRGRKARK
jgi:DNA-binding transcriptional regulator YiaG